jgi:hypothetical protein
VHPCASDSGASLPVCAARVYVCLSVSTCGCVRVTLSGRVCVCESVYLSLCVCVCVYKGGAQAHTHTHTHTWMKAMKEAKEDDRMKLTQLQRLMHDQAQALKVPVSI